jgi:hypothetical protein
LIAASGAEGTGCKGLRKERVKKWSFSKGL